jgi:hypothetical protein
LLVAAALGADAAAEAVAVTVAEAVLAEAVGVGAERVVLLALRKGAAEAEAATDTATANDNCSDYIKQCFEVHCNVFVLFYCCYRVCAIISSVMTTNTTDSFTGCISDLIHMIMISSIMSPQGEGTKRPFSLKKLSSLTQDRTRGEAERVTRGFWTIAAAAAA